MSAVTPSSPTSLAAPALVQFQLGLFREVVRVPAANLSYRHAKRLAAEIIERKAPDCSVVGVGEKILLFRHQTASELLLHRLTDNDELQDGDLIDVIIAESASVTEMRIRPHNLVVQSYRTPTFCHHCGEMLWGLVRQGLKCDGCGLDFHKRCAFQLPNDCSRVRRQVSTSMSLFPPRRRRAHSLTNQAGGSLEEISMSKPSSRPPSWAEPPVWLGIGYGDRSRAQVPHTFHIHSYTKPTVCQYCHRLLRGLFRQGLQCSDCRFNCHRRCEQLVPRDCPGERRDVNGEDSTAVGHSFPPDPEDDESELTSTTTLELSDDEMSTDGDSMIEIKEDEQLREPMSPCFSSYIPLMRLVQTVHHTKRRAGGVLREGWLLHHTNTDTMRKRHYWILDWKSFTLYQNESSTKYYKEITLSEVLQVRGPAQLSVPSLPGNSAHSFEVVTATLVYCVVAGETGPAWESAIRQALMPVQSSGGHREENQDKDSHRESVDISSVYQIVTDEVLGSGQFGVVYRGTHRKSGRPVAIKVIDKTRFPTKQERQLRNEVTILQNLSHLGVVLVEGMFETMEYVFVVMEKLHGDMLEMILSSEKGRLPERNTRFLVTQILEALRYLHFKHIAHCDLKPENVLLASADPFPQVKLCDFGFARIIGEKSFRRSVVGTPAYLAPEVISSSGYNRSLDMWSVGVIMYVSLSGTFPFNEDEDIRQQITNAAFMYPRQPWASISLEAVSLINNLLQVSVRRRFSVGKALGHPWLQDFQLWCDLREFEQRMGCRYLTHKGDEERWIRYAEERGLSFPSHLCWDPDNDPDM
ncbi:protein kinase D4 isoform X1 [Siniperca chuatsi]|uniref:protein kinase D4 isoform X1 n=1 Tax=Siniperca chuatsi TaxID=119488 RepID=UPI001CE1505B|nr:protein kinase D4 isoform X1 [Siniperca chuatsi]XP_044040942.1 protein kinase D4 isoform X1 [Siniperca chuatsi]XP_044040943.1 protein kinase D4 isoform X1 [Siniperca chuatsi]